MDTLHPKASQGCPSHGSQITKFLLRTVPETACRAPDDEPHPLGPGRPGPSSGPHGRGGGGLTQWPPELHPWDGMAALCLQGAAHGSHPQALLGSLHPGPRNGRCVAQPSPCKAWLRLGPGDPGRPGLPLPRAPLAGAQDSRGPHPSCGPHTSRQLSPVARATCRAGGRHSRRVPRPSPWGPQPQMVYLRCFVVPF